MAEEDRAEKLSQPLDRRKFVRAAGTVIAGFAFTTEACGDNPTDAPLGTVQFAIIGLPGGATDFGTVLLSRPNEPDMLYDVPTAAAELSVPIGEYRVVYTPPPGFAMAAGVPNDITRTVSVDVPVIAQFVVTASTGVLRVSVSGLPGGGTSGGVADVLRTDIGGQVPLIVPIPHPGDSVDVNVLAGNYSIDYNPPAGFRLVAGAPNPRTTTVSAGVMGTAAFPVEVIPTGGGGGSALFSSDWSTALGQSSAALLDTGKARSWGQQVGCGTCGDVLTVVAATGLNFPTTNALQVDLRFVGGTTQNMKTGEVSLLPGSGAWPIPGIGDSLYFRFYKRFVYPLGIALGANNHCFENRSGGSTNWSWIFTSSVTGFSPRFQIWRSSGDLDRFILGSNGTPLYLPRDTSFRIEFAVHRTGTNSRTHEIRIYNAAGTLLYDSDDFYMEASPATILTGYSTGYQNPAAMDGLQIGTNGPHVVGALANVAPAWYFAGLAVKSDDWCGPYAGGV